MPILTWIGKDKVVNHHHDVPYRVLEHKYGFRAEDDGDRTPTESGITVLLETKGDDRDNSDSRSKIELGRTWANKAGEMYRYFMVFDKQQMDGAVTIKELLQRLSAM